MTRIGCRAHDYGKLPAAALAATLRAKGYNAAQLAMPRAIAGIEDFSHITDKQLAEIRTAFAAQDVEISVLSCYQDLSAPDADTRLLKNAGQSDKAKEMCDRVTASQSYSEALNIVSEYVETELSPTPAPKRDRGDAR